MSACSSAKRMRGGIQQTVEAAQNVFPDSSLMDLNLPRMRGVASTPRIREMRGRRNVGPVISVMAYDTEEDRRSAVLAGCND